MPTDLPSAARLVAARFRAEAAAGRADAAVPMVEAALILPLLDAAAGRLDYEGRVERWARLLAHQHFDRKQHVGACTKAERLAYVVEEQWQRWTPEARAAIALADAERATAAAEGWAEYEVCWEEMMQAADRRFSDRHHARSVLDAAVRRLAGLLDPA